MNDLKDFAVTELSLQDKKKVEGGGLLLMIAAGLIAMGIHDSIDHPDAFLDGFFGNAYEF